MTLQSGSRWTFSLQPLLCTALSEPTSRDPEQQVESVPERTARPCLAPGRRGTCQCGVCPPTCVSEHTLPFPALRRRRILALRLKPACRDARSAPSRQAHYLSKPTIAASRESRQTQSSCLPLKVTLGGGGHCFSHLTDLGLWLGGSG